MQLNLVLLALACSATAHWVAAAVMALYARYKVQYLSLAWINGIFAFVLTISSLFSEQIAQGTPGIMHPMMLLVLVASCYLQSIYPLSIPMPGYLQWGRMWQYASPAIALMVAYGLLMLVVGHPRYIYSWDELRHNLLSFDLLLRVVGLGLSVYYIVNIFRLPRRNAHKAVVPRYIFGYCTALGLSVVFYAFVTVFYDKYLLLVYIIVFTLLNLYLVFRILETMAIHLPQPMIEDVKEEPAQEIVEKAEREDFNEANLLRFRHVEFWMQNNKQEWTESSFGRDRLCRCVGYNRHLLLQSVRSQGYNNIHEYINRYRIEELKRLIQRGKVRSVSDSMLAGFGTTVTARSCFERMEGVALDAYLSQCAKKMTIDS